MCPDYWIEGWGLQADVIGKLLISTLGNKTGPVSPLAANTDEEINERIFVVISSYTTESNEYTFKPDTIFESFHHQAKISISDRALLAVFLMLWLKRCVMPTLSHEIRAANVVYPAVLLDHDRPLGLLPVMMRCLQSGLRMLTLSFCHMEVMEDNEGNAILDRSQRGRMPIPMLSCPTHT